jgi:hypothetical protein
MLKLIVFIVILFCLLVHFKQVEDETENFISGLKMNRMEHFENDVPDINAIRVNSNTEMQDEESYEEPIEEEEEVKPKVELDPSKEEPVCRSKGKTKTGDCMFGCPDEEEPVEEKKTDLQEMILTIEETEKICDLIEEKDRIRKEKEDYESLKKQLELNKKMLIQQKAQDKQIKDLEEIVKSMTFTHEMNEAAVAKCGKHKDDCLTDKEKYMRKLLLEKEKQAKNVKININLKNFGEEFLAHLLQKLSLSDSEIQNLINAINRGELNVDEVSSGCLSKVLFTFLFFYFYILNVISTHFNCYIINYNCD